MPHNIRTSMIRLAASLPKGSPERRTLLGALSDKALLFVEEAKDWLYEDTLKFEDVRKQLELQGRRGEGDVDIRQPRRPVHLPSELDLLLREIRSRERILKQFKAPVTPHRPGTKPVRQ